jgi:hypothetical protein
VVQAAGQEEAASGEEDDELIAHAHEKGSKPAPARRSSPPPRPSCAIQHHAPLVTVVSRVGAKADQTADVKAASDPFPFRLALTA